MCDRLFSICFKKKVERKYYTHQTFGFLFMACFFKILFLFLLLLCHTVCRPIYANGNAENKMVNGDFFVLENMKNVDGPNGKVKSNIIFEEIKLPNFLSVKDGVIFAVAKTKYTENDNAGQQKKIFGVVTKYFDAKSNAEWYNNIFKEINNWKTQLVTENNYNVDNFSTTIASTVNAEKNKIYIFLLTINDEQRTQQWSFKLVEGTISGEKEEDKTIAWNTKELTESKANEETKQKITEETFNFAVSNGYVFLTDEHKILFVVKGTFVELGDSSGPKGVTVSFLFDKTGTTLNLLRVERTVGWYSFFQWEGKIYKTPTSDQSSGNDNVMVLDVNEKKFTERNSSISNLRDFLKDKKNFATTKIGGQNVLLLTQEKFDGARIDVFLWITDGSRVGYVGDIITNFPTTFYGSFLFIKNELFVLYSVYEIVRSITEKVVSSLMLLKEQLNKIENMLHVWNKSNINIKKLCENTSTVTIPCSTDGLVGFLSGDSNDNNWQDEYFYMNASVSNGERLENGFSFNKKGARVMWPVGGKENNNELYNFTDPGFTLFATVVIDNTAEKEAPNSVLGITVKKTAVESITKNIGLFCSEDNEWTVSAENNKILKTSNKKCEEKKTYSVALVLTNENLEIYVDGEQLTVLNGNKAKINKEDYIEHFYFGADSKTQQAKTDVTITNVLLYNRPFTTSEFYQLKQKLNNAAGLQKQHENDNSKPQDPNGSTTDTKQPPGTSANESENKKRSSSTEDSAVCVGVVWVLCFMLFGVFTLLGRYVY